VLYRTLLCHSLSVSRLSHLAGDQNSPGFSRSRNKVSGSGLRALQCCKKCDSAPGLILHVSTVQIGICETSSIVGKPGEKRIQQVRASLEAVIAPNQDMKPWLALGRVEVKSPHP
jgi:hypothetical protein